MAETVPIRADWGSGGISIPEAQILEITFGAIRFEFDLYSTGSA
ncbi:MAG: hypothetical protein AB1898_05550 [Acidobacteriota bacterium]